MALNITPRSIVSSMKPTAMPLRRRLKKIFASLPDWRWTLAPVQEPEPCHDGHDGQHPNYPDAQPDQHLADEQRPAQPVADTCFVGEPDAACDEDEADHEGEHPDAVAYAMEREIEVGMQQQPRRVSEDGDRASAASISPKNKSERTHQRGTSTTGSNNAANTQAVGVSGKAVPR